MTPWTLLQVLQTRFSTNYVYSVSSESEILCEFIFLTLVYLSAIPRFYAYVFNVRNTNIIHFIL